VPEDSGVELQHVSPRLFGRIPPPGVLGAGGVLFLAGVALLGAAYWAVAAVLLVFGLLLLALYAVAARHLPPTQVGRHAVGRIWRARDELRFAGSTTRAWTGAGRQVLVLQRELRRLARERDAVQHELGGAVYRGDETAAAELRERMRLLGRRVEECADAIQEARRGAEERVSRARATLAATEIVKHEP
jgi:hypothetical protein